MKWLVLLIILMGVVQVYAEPCNQKAYDQIYKKNVILSMTDPEHHSIEDKNKIIRYLRWLCKGQKSSYESKWKGNK